jgi:hypothetical protein
VLTSSLRRARMRVRSSYYHDYYGDSVEVNWDTIGSDAAFESLVAACAEILRLRERSTPQGDGQITTDGDEVL